MMGRRMTMLKLSDRQWKPFTIGDYFTVMGTTTIPPQKLILCGNTPRVTCMAGNNGLDDTYQNKPTEDGDVLTIDSATTGAIAYQPYKFIATDHVEKITLKNGRTMGHLCGLFLKVVIEMAIKDKYGYGYKFSQSRIEHQQIFLPTTPEGTPDWQFMHDYMYEQERLKIRSLIKHLTKQYNINEQYLISHTLNATFKDVKWGVFTVGNFFDVILAKGDLKPKDLQEGKCPLISAGKTDNGLEMMFNNKKTKSDWLPKNSITFDMFGNCFVQPFPFYAVGHGRVNICVPKSPLPFHTLTFIATCMNKEQYQFSYNHAAYTYVVNRLKIHLPITSSGTPDWDFMEAYIRLHEQTILKKSLTILQHLYPLI